MLLSFKFLSVLKVTAFCVFVALISLLPTSFKLSAVDVRKITADSTIKVDILFAGDAMVHSTQYNSAYIKELDVHDFHPVFKFIKPYLAQNDINVVNLETTLAGRPYAGYPNFSSPDTFAYALKEAGFNVFALANNHSVDRGKNGLLRTLDVLDNYGLPSVGTYRDGFDKAERHPLMIEANNVNIALLNYTYGTNGIVVPHPTIVNLIDTALIRQDIRAAQQKNADFIMVYFHWGAEYRREPNNAQKELAAFTFSAGADIIIGTHPHVVQPVEMLDVNNDNGTEKKWVAWSLGNFVSNQRKEYTDGGIMLKFTVEKNVYTRKTFVSNMTYIPYWVYRPLEPTKFYILPVAEIEKNNKLFPEMSSEDRQALDFFVSETRSLLNNASDDIKEWRHSDND